MWSSLFTQTKPHETLVYQIEQLQVKTNIEPIGGYRGKVGALKIEHINHKVLTDWDSTDLKQLAQVVQKILGIYNQAGVQNVLIFAKQDEQQFKFCLIPYPKCNWIEKVQGIVHAIFGGKILSEKQEKEIASFYQTKFCQNFPLRDDSACRKFKEDVFCNPIIIKKQLIADISIEGKTYHLLHDNCPKGRTLKDPHLLVIPEGKDGHCHETNQLTEQRFHMLTIIQKALKILLNEGHKTVIYLERNGSKLQGVPHKHAHALGIGCFPQTFFEKIKTILRLVWPAILPTQILQEKIKNYQAYKWV